MKGNESGEKYKGSFSLHLTVITGCKTKVNQAVQCPQEESN